MVALHDLFTEGDVPLEHLPFIHRQSQLRHSNSVLQE
jgi:hypothetical protein